MQRVLEDRAIVLIGGTSGLGLSAAEAIQRAGGRVAVVGRDDPALEAAERVLGADALVRAGDATDPDVPRRAIAEALSVFGRFDALYHVAGGSARRQGDGPLHEVTDQGIDAAIQQNLIAAIYSNRAAAESFLQRGVAGVVLNMASVLAYSPSPRFFATHVYAAAKAGVIGLTRSCAAYYAAHEIRFNAIAPALVETPMSTRACGDPEIRRFVRTKQPLDGGRISRPADLDAAAVFLLSEQSGLVTGQVLGVDGGWSVSEGQFETET
jgi:NAD(P)-dependent dehydrogenase (short-subunit alcohol dehydrogenase family)